jgi:hypothetical protein
LVSSTGYGVSTAITPQQIADRYRASQYPEPLRTAKAKALADRMHVDWSLVEVLLAREE